MLAIESTLLAHNLDRTRTQLSRSRCLVLSSFSEGLPVSVLEAWAWRLPVLMSEYCNLRAGFTVGAAINSGVTPESISEALVELSSLSDAERIKMGAAGCKLVEQSFSWERIADQFVSLYRSCSSVRKGPGGQPGDSLSFS